MLPLLALLVASAHGVRPVGNPGDWITASDYPKAAIRSHSEGTTGFRLAISPDGSITACTIISSSGDATLDRTSCELLKARAHFQPAADAAGKAVASSYASTVRWELPTEVHTVAVSGGRLPAEVSQTPDPYLPKECRDDSPPGEPLSYCAGIAWQNADKVLNETYLRAKAMMHRLDLAGEKSCYPAAPNNGAKCLGYEEAFVRSERAWIAFRDQDCIVDGYAERETESESLNLIGCREDKTVDRITEIKAIIAEYTQSPES